MYNQYQINLITCIAILGQDTGLVTTGVSQVLYRCFIGVLLVYTPVKPEFNPSVVRVADQWVINPNRSLPKLVSKLTVLCIMYTPQLILITFN